MENNNIWISKEEWDLAKGLQNQIEDRWWIKSFWGIDFTDEQFNNYIKDLKKENGK